MSEEELNEAIEYNQEYMEAMLSEEIFGGDYTSSVELKYANKETDRLQQENQLLQNNWNELKKWLEEEVLEYKKVNYSSEYGLVIGTIGRMLIKMQELEGNNE